MIQLENPGETHVKLHKNRANKLLFFIMIPPRFKDKTFPETFLETFPTL